MRFLQKNRKKKCNDRIRKGLAFGLILFMTLMIVGCGSSEQENASLKEDEGKEEAVAYYSFTDDLGVEISLETQPKTVAVLFSSYADVWVTAGGTVDISVGEAVERGFAAETVILVDEGAGKTIDMEGLVEAEPDLVICSADIEAQVEAATLLNENRIPAACFQVDTFDDYLHMLKICTDITGNEEAYQHYGVDVQERIQKIIAGTDGKTKKKILFVRAGSSSSATKAKTAEENFVCGMLKELGTYNIAEDAPVLLDGLSIEEILVQDPEYIFISTMGKEEEVRAYMDAVLEEPQWQSLTAISEGNYAYLPKDLFQYKPNSRWDEAYSYLVGLLYE